MNIIDAATTMVDACTAKHLSLRLLGGIAVCIHSGDIHNPGRSYRDIDAFIPAKSQAAVTHVLRDLGYLENREFNLLNGDTRLLFYHQEHGFQVDIFVGEFSMCHTIPIRTSTHAYTIPLAELLLTKLQIVQLNPKDAHDGCALLNTQCIGTNPLLQSERDVISALCSKDWGLWRTFTMNLERCHEYTTTHCPELTPRIHQEVQALRTAIDATPKSLAFKMRAAIGDKMPWYELPEEVDR